MVASVSERLPASGAAPSSQGARARYVRLFALGEGGMGVVEAALERGGGGFERVVALKRLLPAAVAAAAAGKPSRHREMFLREARLAALLNHPNVVHAFAAGEADGECFLAMEYVEGEPLSRVLETARACGKPLTPALVAHVLADACEGLHAAHELRDIGGAPLNVVHRDVSPSNVMIAYEGHVKLLDFGVAKMELLAASSLTKTGEVKGKMSYMSPEQAMGDAVDRRTDLYAVGAVLYEALVGRPMWGDGTDLEIMRKLALEEAPRLADALPGVAPALASLHARLVARAPASRPASAREVADVLRAVAAEGPRPAHRGALRDTMTELFADAAAERRRQLNVALAAVAPAQADELRKSISIAPSALAPPSARVAVASRAPVSRPSSPSRWRPFAVAVALVVAAGAVAFVKARTPAPATPQPTPASTQNAEAPPAPIAPASAAAPLAGQLADPVARPAAAPAVPAVSARRPQPRTTPTPRSTASSRPLDVDPTPF